MRWKVETIEAGFDGVKTEQDARLLELRDVKVQCMDREY